MKILPLYQEYIAGQSDYFSSKTNHVNLTKHVIEQTVVTKTYKYQNLMALTHIHLYNNALEKVLLSLITELTSELLNKVCIKNIYIKAFI